jgi:hypothetical protein
MEVNGIAHVFLTASNFERSRAFYRKLLPFLGLKPVPTQLITESADARRSGSARRRPSTQAPRSSKSASACIIYVFVPESAPTSMNCTDFCACST